MDKEDRRWGSCLPAGVHMRFLGDEGYSAATIAIMLHVRTATVTCTRHKYVPYGLADG